MCVNKVTLLVVFICLRNVYAFDEMTSHVYIHEANPGESVILHCSSNDKTHNFMFWHFIKNGIVIGPRNDFNTNKYQFEVLTGNLTIRGLTNREAGLYSCISDGLTRRDILVSSIKLHIKSDGHEAQSLHNGNANSSNLWITCAILGGILVILILVGVFLHIYHKSTKKPKYFDVVNNDDGEEEEDSTEELFTRQPSTSTAKNNVPADRRDDFDKVYTAININNT
ncbi:hypothetical protein CBL_04563 [Carabus blaptoides fortunei]